MSTLKLLNSAGITAAIGLASLPAFLTLFPAVLYSTAHAETTETLGTSATVRSTLGLSANSINLNINPSSTGAVFKTGKAIATVSTNNETGYTLYLSDNDTNNSLNHSNLADVAITSTASDLTGANMLANTWGYTLETSESETEDEVDNATNLALTYSPIPTLRTMIKKTDNAVSSESTPVTFGVKVDTGIPSGVYSDKVFITAIPNYSAAAYEDSLLWLNSEGIQISTMQEMTHEICASVPMPAVFKSDGTINTSVPQITLTDVRDGSTYAVRKLADGNCWMAGELKLTKETATYPEVSGMTNGVLEPTYTDMTSGTFSLPNTRNIEKGNPIVEETPEQPHIYKDYSSLVHYNFYAASLNSPISGPYPKNISNTICPKGWTMPAGGNLPADAESHVDGEEYDTVITTGFDPTDDNSYSFVNLAQAYRMAYVNKWTVDSDPVIKGHNKAAATRMFSAPLNFSLAGRYEYERGDVFTGAGHWWTSTATSGQAANDMAITKELVSPRFIHTFKYGFSVRCVAR